MTDVQTLPDAELDRLGHDVRREQDRRAVLANVPTLAARLSDDYETAVAPQGPVPFTPVPQFGHGPGTVVTFNAEQWRNTSGAWLTVSPDAYPLGWSQITGLPTDVQQWAAGEAVTAGDMREYQGTVYRCLQDHTTQDGWEPPNVPALWAPQGG